MALFRSQSLVNIPKSWRLFTKRYGNKKKSTKPTTKEFKKISLPPQSSGPFAPWAHASACGRWAPLQVSKSSSGNDSQWIGLRENLQETMDFTIKYRAFL
jgi:hypothetical protein